jgi:hypothetical protein
MPQPVITDLHVDGLLTPISILYMNEDDAFVVDKAFPIVPVRKQSDKVAKYTKEFWFRDEAKIRAPGTETHGSGYEVDTSTTYYANNYGFHLDVPDEERKNYDQPFDPDNDATMLVVEKMKLVRENKFATDNFTTSVWATDVVGGTDFTKWSDYANSAPIEDVETGREAIYSSTAREANKMLIGRAVWSKLKHHPDFIERIKYSQKGVLTAEIVASILDIEQILIGKVIKTATIEGQTATFSYVFGKHCLLLHTPRRPGLRVPTAGYTFHWNVFGGISYIRRIHDDKAQYDRIEGHTFFDQKVLGTDCGYFMQNAVT